MARGKKKIKGLIAAALTVFSLVSFSPNTSVITYADTISESQSQEDSRLTFEEEQGAILHAWNWSFQTITNNMDEISKAGYKSVQVSPIQGNIDVDGSMKTTDKWWVLYQPINFKIGNKQLGTEEEFKNMCDKAHEKGIKVIVDVIVNHTGNTLTDSDTPSQYVDNDIKSLGKDAWHKLVPVESWDSRYSVTQEDIGLPDLNTENTKIQQLASNYLKECLLCGADGFRFDTAKHIALPDEDDDNGKVVRSDFWTNVLKGLKTNEGNTPYIYGEVLQGGADNYADYANYINLTSSNYGGRVRSAVGLGADADVSKIEDYDSDGVSPKKLISWVESHDTYANDSEESTALTDEQIRDGWALIASRADANPLFFNRPAGRGKLDGYMGDTGDDNWRNPDVTAVNKFRTAMLNEDEKLIEISRKIMMIERGTKEDSNARGIVIVNLDEDKQINDQDVNLEDGTYENCASQDAEFKVNNGKISGTIPKGVTVIYKGGQKEQTVQSPVVSIDKENQSFTDKLELTLKVSNAQKSTYSINNGEKIPYSNDTKITIGDKVNPGEKAVITLEAVNSDGTRKAKETYIYIKKAIGSTATVYFEKPDSWKAPVYLYAYNEVGDKNNNWPGEKMTKIGENLYKYELNDWTNCKVMINDSYAGNNKTGDLELNYNSMMKYSLDGKWAASEKLDEDPNIEQDKEIEGTSKVYIQEPEDWKDDNGDYYDDVYVYMYGVSELAKWPGVPMQKVEGSEGLYTYTLPAGLEGSMVLFNADGGKVQVPKDTGFKAPADSTMIYENGEWKQYLKGISKAYFRKPADWEDAYIYVWKDDGSKIADWPGIQISKVNGTETLYSYTLPENYGDCNIIFNDGKSNKTADLKLSNESAMIYDNGEYRGFKTDDLQEPEVETDSEGVTKVYFKNDFGWDKVKVYAYNDGTAEKVRDWPGVSAKDEGDGLYSYTLPAGFEEATVIFNNGNGGEGNQTGNLKTIFGHTMIYDKSTDLLNSMGKVYFKNKYGWDKVRIHYWKADGTSTKWPGESLEYYGDDLYSYTLPSGYGDADIIFNNNNGGEQTKDIKLEDGKTFIFIGNSKEDIKNCDGEWREFEKSDISNSDIQEPDQDGDELTKAYFYNDKGLSRLKIYVYTENADGSLKRELAKWPGLDLDNEGDNLYSYTLPKGFKNSTLIFSGDVTTSAAVSVDEEERIQTDNLKIKEGELMIYKDGSWDKYSKPEKPNPEDPGEKDNDEIKEVTIKGTNKKGMILTTEVINKGDEKVDNGLKYQWYRSSDENGDYKIIDGAVKSTYKLTQKDCGKYIKVIVEDENGNKVSSDPKKIQYSSSSSSRRTSSTDKKDTSDDENTADNPVSVDVSDNNNSALNEGWIKKADNTWIFVENQKIVTGWKYINGIWYYMNNDGIMQIGWQNINGVWYYLNEDGSMQKGWKFVNYKWYYLNEDGSMAMGWKEVNGIWYYLYENGSMASNTSIDGYEVNYDGAWVS